MPGSFSVLMSALRLAPRTAWRTAGRVVRDIGSKDPALASAALRMVGYHAAAGAAAGGAYNYARGQDVGRGAVSGAMAGAGFGMMGGVGTVRNLYRGGYARAARKEFRGALFQGMGSSGRDATRLVNMAYVDGLRRGIVDTKAPKMWGGNYARRSRKFLMGGYRL